MIKFPMGELFRKNNMLSLLPAKHQFRILILTKEWAKNSIHLYGLKHHSLVWKSFHNKCGDSIHNSFEQTDGKFILTSSMKNISKVVVDFFSKDQAMVLFQHFTSSMKN